MSAKRQKHERKDAFWQKDAPSMNTYMPYILPGRIANEAVAEMEIDLTEVNSFLEKKNAENPSFHYTIFQVVTAALVKTAFLRPKLNGFISGHRLYMRKDLSASFVCKKTLDDKGEEALVTYIADTDSEICPMEQVHSLIEKKVTGIRKENKSDSATDVMDVLKKLPRWFLRIFTRFILWADYHGIVPSSLMTDVPYYSSIFISNLGSIKISASYHHLANFGTNSFFVCIGEKAWKPVFAKDGSYVMKEMLPVSFTLDERIADGTYYAKSFRLFKGLTEHPTELEKPFSARPEFDF